MLTLTITDPSALTLAERAALAMLFTDAPPRAVTPAAIPAEDRPDAGAPPLVIPRVTEAKFERVRAPIAPIPPAPAPAAAPAIDAAAVFGGAAAAPSVPVPPPVPTPPAPDAIAAASPPESAPIAAAGGPPGTVALDSKGLPWDVRIHASTKGQNADGGWKKKKNTPDEVIKAVEAELRALMGIKAAKPLPAGAVAVPDGETPTTFAQLMGWVTQEVAKETLTQAEVTGIVAPIGLASVVGLNMRPDLIPQVHAELDALIKAKAP